VEVPVTAEVATNVPPAELAALRKRLEELDAKAYAEWKKRQLRAQEKEGGTLTRLLAFVRGK
jgi:hypothetical protein